MLQAHDLYKRFGSNTAVSGVSFDISPGEIVGFLGPNGAGKSTTMRMLSGFLKPDQGRAMICSVDVDDQPAMAQAHLGYMPEAATGFGNLTVGEFLLYCAQSRGMSQAASSDAIYNIAEQTELRPALGKVMRSLSKGWRQRAWFAQSVLHDPEVLILDEPTDGLDPGQKNHVRDYIRHISSDKSIILSTHILEEAEELCNRLIVINAGKIVADASTKSMLDTKGRLASTFAELTPDRPTA